MVALGTHRLDRVALAVVELVDRGRLHRRQQGDHAVELVGLDVELDQHLAPGLEHALEQREDLAHGVGLGRIGVGGGVGHQLGVGGQHRVDDAQAGGADGPPGLGDVHDAVDDVGHLGLGGAVGQRDVGLDAPIGEEALGQTGVLARDPHALRQVLDALPGSVVGHGHDDLHRVVGGLGVAQLPQAHHVGLGLLHPVPPGDADVEEAVGHVGADLLRAEDAHLVDAGIVDAGPVGHHRVPVHPQVGGLEELEGGLLQRPLGQHQLQHGGHRSQPAPTLRNGLAAAGAPATLFGPPDTAGVGTLRCQAGAGGV